MGLYYEEFGSKNSPSIVFIHGGGVGGWMWKKQIEYFKDYHCIVPDLPGHGKNSEKDIASIGDCADMISELIQSKANNRKAHLVGHSLGAKTLVVLLAKNPELIDHAVVASALFRPTVLSVFFRRPIYKSVVVMNKSAALLRMQAKQFEFPEESYINNFINDTKSLTVDKLDKLYSELYKNLKIPEVIEKPDGLVINGKDRLNGGVVESWNDHRIAMALAIASIKCKEPVIIKGSDAVKKSYPEFFEHFAMLGGNVEKFEMD